MNYGSAIISNHASSTGVASRINVVDGKSWETPLDGGARTGWDELDLEGVLSCAAASGSCER
jgi:hypothetical protein